MITFDIFLLGLLVVSIATGLLTEAFKVFLDGCNKAYNSNILASVASVISSILIGFGYIVLNGISINTPVVVYLIALTIGSWLCAMVGYDKVVGMFKNIK